MFEEKQVNGNLPDFKGTLRYDKKNFYIIGTLNFTVVRSYLLQS